MDVRKRSSSGGMFFTLARYVIATGGVVYGAAWTEELHLKHIGAENEQELEKLLRSKYVQSDTIDVFLQAKKQLDSGRQVLFCGTPCQIAAMKSFLRGKEYENLLLVDVICQGVPSPSVFQKYIDEIETKKKARVIDVSFRSKKYGWRCGLLLLLLCEDGRVFEIKYAKNAFYRSFLRNYFLRESCYNCKFKENDKGTFADLTLADFWRIGTKVSYHCKSYDSGISAVLTNTVKGEKAFDAVKETIVWEERSFSEFSTNGGLSVAQKPKYLEQAFEAVKTDDFDSIQTKFFPYTWASFLSDWIMLHFPQRTIQRIKKWLRR